MADYRLIGAYLDELAEVMRWHHAAEDIVAETEDHLCCAVERLIAEGQSAEAAQREVLDSFGGPTTIARAHASTRRGRLALPTTSTRDAGVVALASGGLWLILPPVWFGAGLLYDRVGDNAAPDEIGNPVQVALMLTIAVTLMGAVAALLATTLTLRDRHGEFTAPGLVGIAAIGAGVAASMMGWFFAGWGSLVIIGTALIATELWRQAIAPKRSVTALGAGPTLGGLTWGVLRFFEVGSPDQFGDYQIANAAGLTTGPILLALGLIGLGRWLTNEEPIGLTDPTPPAPA